MAPKGAELDVDRRILELYARPEALYRAADVCRLLGLSSEELQERIDGALPYVPNGRELLFRWEDVAQMALEIRTAREIFHIVRDAGRETAIPDLNRFRTVAVELPLYQIRLLHHLAVVRSANRSSPVNASDVLELQLLNMTYDEPELARTLPGVADAATYPRKISSRPAVINCLYCGAKVEGDGETCAPCTARHVPPDG